MAREPIWVYNRFLVIIDRAGDPSIEDYEFTEQFNLSNLSVFKDRFGNDRLRDQSGNSQYAWEMSDTDTVKWQPLIVEETLNTNANGNVTISDIETKVQGKIYHIKFARKDTNGEFRYCRFVRQNDSGIQYQNSFKKYSDKFPTWQGFKDYYQIFPNGESVLKFVVIKYPDELVLDFNNPANNKPTNMTDSVIDEVLWRMAAQYGIQIREQQLVDNATAQEMKQ